MTISLHAALWLIVLQAILAAWLVPVTLKLSDEDNAGCVVTGLTVLLLVISTAGFSHTVWTHYRLVVP